MANHRSALKAHRQSLINRARNRHFRSMVRNAVKTFRTAIESGEDLASVEKAFKASERTVRRVATKGVIHWRAADRTISRLAHRFNAFKREQG